MSDKINAADAIRRLAKQYEQMVFAAEVLDKIGSLDQVTKEQSAAADAARAEADKAKAEVKKAKDDLKKVKDDAAEVVADAQAKADRVRGEAEIEANRLIEDAASQATVAASKIIDAARAEAVSIKESTKADVAKANKAKADLQAAEAELVKLQAAIDALKSKFV